MSSLSWLGKTLCPPDCLVKSDIKAPSCAAIFRLGIVVFQCVRMGEVFCGLHVAHVHIICPVRDVTHVRKCTRPSPAFPYYKRRKAGRGPGNEATERQRLQISQRSFSGPTQFFIARMRSCAECSEGGMACLAPKFSWFGSMESLGMRLACILHDLQS